MAGKDAGKASPLTDKITPARIPRLYEHDHAPRYHLTSEPNRAAESDSDTIATNSSDEFDEDDEGEKQPDEPLIKAKRGRALWLAFMKLARPVRVWLVGSLGAGIFITPLLVVDLRFKDSPARIQAHVWSLWLTIIWAAGCVTYLTVDSVPHIIVRVITLFGGQVERLKAQIELMMAVLSWLKLTLDISWAWISLSILRSVYNPPGAYWSTINRVMQVLFAAGVLLLAEKVFLHFVAINFHERALADRLAENRMALKALDHLSNAQPVNRRAPYYLRRGHRSPSASIDILSGQRSTDHSTEASPVHTDAERSYPFSEKPQKQRKHQNKHKRRKPMTSVIVDQLGGAIGQVALKNSRFNRAGSLNGLFSARRLAKKLFSALTDTYPPRSHLVVEDFYPYFRSTEEAHEAFALFDKDDNGDITKREMREAVQRIYRERKALVGSLKDMDSIVAKLDAVLLAIAMVGVIFVCLLIFSRKNTLASLVPLATIILGFSFIFGHSAQTLFESLIFIFSTHVFDVGDLVMIDDQVLFVKEFGLFATTFRRVDGQEVIAPNALLASTKLVHNLRRSKSTWESTVLTISYNTPLKLIEELKIRLNAYVSQNSRDWLSCAVNIDKMEYQNSISLIVAIEHRPNWQDWGGRWERRTAFMRNLKTVLEELDIRYTMPVQPIILSQRGAPIPSLQPSMRSDIKLSDDLLGNGARF